MNHRTHAATGAKFTWLEDHNILLSLGVGHRRCIGYMELNTLQLKQMLGEKVVSCWNYHIRDCSISSLYTWSSSFSPLLWCPLGTDQHYWVSSWVLWCQRHYPQWTCLKRLAAQPCLGTHGPDLSSHDTTWHHTSSARPHLTSPTSPEVLILPSPNQYSASGKPRHRETHQGQAAMLW